MNKQVNAWLADHLDEMMDTLRVLVSYPSVVSAPEGAYPYGKTVGRCLEEFLRIADGMGMRTKNVGYHAGTVELTETPAKLGILCHLDVVPAGDGWPHDPFELTIRDGRAYGRGTIDDKGPAVAVLYAMRAIRELGLPLAEGVRLIAGCCEEIGGPDMERYQEYEAFPPLLFTPDGDFPVINIEKGRLPSQLSAPFTPATERGIRSVSAGTVINAVPGTAQAVLCGYGKPEVLELARSMPFDGITFHAEESDTGLVLTAIGAAAHASTPAKGKNALTALLAVLAELPGEHESLRALSRLYPYGDHLGTAAGVACEDEVSGPLTMQLTVLHTGDQGLTASVDCRFPVAFTGAELAEKLRVSTAAAGLICVSDPVEPHYVDSNGDFVRTLLEVYEDHTGLPGECLAIGGGTYVHDTKNGVAFGPEFPGEGTNAHAIGENMPLASLLKCAQMYADTILRLCGE